MEWLNEPASWQRIDDVLKVNVDPGTDFWRVTGYGYIRDSGHVYGDVLAGDLDVAVRVRGNWATQYDQAGVMLRADERTWLKTGVEVFEGRPRLSTVLTLGMSSWTVANLPGDTDDIALRVSRRGDAVEIRYSTGDDGSPDLAALVYLPPDTELLAGVMCAAPEGSGFSVSFRELRIAAREPQPAS
jgi:regulation of enolase protein 1 (concanavalin A-like superfamily)